jgi:DNA replication protein DnaC
VPKVDAGNRRHLVPRQDEPLRITGIVDDSPPTWKQEALARARAGGLCPVCLGLRVTRLDVPITHPEFGKMQDCPACSEGRLSEYLRQNSGLEDWLAHARPDDYIHTDERSPQFQAAMEILKRGHGWLTLWGIYGSSKTFLLASVLNEFIRDRKQGVYTTAGALLDHLRDSYKEGGPGYSYAFDQWSSCFALAVDEVDAFHSTEWAMDKYRQLLDRRYNLKDEAVTLFASNVEPGSSEWPVTLDWLASRMSEFPVVEATGPDVRPMLKDQKF